MVDPLRQNLKRILDECPAVILENPDIEDLLDGRVDKIIEKEQHEDEVIDTALNEPEDEDFEVISTGDGDTEINLNDFAEINDDEPTPTVGLVTVD